MLTADIKFFGGTFVSCLPLYVLKQLACVSAYTSFISMQLDTHGVAVEPDIRKHRVLGRNVKCSLTRQQRCRDVFERHTFCQNVCVMWRNNGESEFVMPEKEAMKKEVWFLCTYFVIQICEN